MQQGWRGHRRRKVRSSRPLRLADFYCSTGFRFSMGLLAYFAMSYSIGACEMYQCRFVRLLVELFLWFVFVLISLSCEAFKFPW